MIFTLWFSIWIIAATSLSMLILPALSLILRGYYTQRAIIINWYYLLIPAIVFLIILFSYPPIVAALWSCRTFLFLLLVQQIMSALKTSKTRIPPLQYDVAYLFHWILRSLKIVQTRIYEIGYARRIRVDRETNYLMKWKQTFLANWEVLRTITVEFIQLVTQLNDIISSRGISPHPKKWQTEVNTKSTIYLGDTFLLIALMGALLIPEANLIPDMVFDLKLYLIDNFDQTIMSRR